MTRNFKINFLNEKFVSVDEIKKNKQLRLASYITVGVAFFLVVTSIFLDIFVSRKLSQEKETNSGLINELNYRENKQKATILLLIKNRLAQVLKIKTKSYSKSPYIKIIKEELDPICSVKSYVLEGKSATLDFETGDYSKFDRLIKNLKEYRIDEKSFYVASTKFEDLSYKISVKFNFL